MTIDALLNHHHQSRQYKNHEDIEYARGDQWLINSKCHFLNLSRGPHHFPYRDQGRE